MRSLVDSFSLREINYAKTRLNILQVVMERIKEKDFTEITVDEICRYAEISRGTFFNHFTTKNHIFKYYISLWKAQICIEIEENSFKHKTIQEKIKYVFKKIVEENEKSPSLFINYLRGIVETKDMNNEIQITGAEFAYRFPNINLDSSKVEKLNDFTLEKTLKELLIEGIEKKELKKDVEIEYITLLLTSLFFSSVIAYKHLTNSNDLYGYYEYSLNNIFDTIKA